MNYKGIYAERLKQLRVGSEMSQYYLADKVHTSQANIARYEKGVSLPSIETMIAIADLFCMSLDYFFGRGATFPRRNSKLKGEIKEVLQEQIQPGQDLYEFIKQATDEIIAKQLAKQKKWGNYGRSYLCQI